MFRRTFVLFLGLMCPVVLVAQPKSGGQIEPNAGSWRTWAIASGAELRVPPPPGAAETRAELRAMADLIAQSDAQAKAQIEFWDAGPPSYRWIDLISARMIAAPPGPAGFPLTSPFAHRV